MKRLRVFPASNPASPILDVKELHIKSETVDPGTGFATYKSDEDLEEGISDSVVFFAKGAMSHFILEEVGE